MVKILATLLLSCATIHAYTTANDDDYEAAWRQLQFTSNVNYRITAILDVNGGATSIPPFASPSAVEFESESEPTSGYADIGDGQKKTATTSAGYSVPIDVLTLYDPKTKRVRQRVSYYSGTQVDYNDNGTGYRSVPLPYEDKLDNWIQTRNRFSTKTSKERDRLCFNIGGGTDHHYLNLFPTKAQMGHYKLGRLVTNEPGIPYRIAALTAPHGSDTEIKPGHCLGPCPDPPYNSKQNNGMPPMDWYQFSFVEGRKGDDDVPRPLEWTMLARYKVINSHTERWVLRYLNYEAIHQESDNAKLWDKWYDDEFRKDCGSDHDNVDGASDDERHVEEDDGMLPTLDRLGMFFSTSTIPSSAAVVTKVDSEVNHDDALLTPVMLSQFDSFLVRNNKDYGSHTSEEYLRRKAIHDANVANLSRWNDEHAGMTTFAPDEFMDMEVGEVLSFRGGVRRRSSSKERRVHDLIDDDSGKNLRGSVMSNYDRHTVAVHQVPDNFDPSSLPESFDWRDKQGVVGPVKDQGFCGSCWAFSLVSALESNWYVATGSSVDIPEQFVVDCVWDKHSSACDGGNYDSAAHTIAVRFQGIVPTRDVYGGYLSVDGECYIDTLQGLGMLDKKPDLLSSSLLSYTIHIDTWKHDDKGNIITAPWWYVPSRDDIAVKQALLAQGPLSITITVVDEMRYYSGGVLDVASCTKNTVNDGDHAITLIGWGVDTLPDGTQAEHWIVRNSWSVLWGDSGYMRVRMGTRDCGITTSAGYPGLDEAKMMASTDVYKTS